MLDKYLILRNLFSYCGHSVEIKQKYLRLSIQNSEYIKDLQCSIDFWCAIGTNDKQIDVNNAILCILHLELHCSENKMLHLLNEGFTHRKSKQMV